jgi:hemerythrin superfamily protein
MFGFTTSDSENAIDILKRDHDEVDALFKDYEAAKEGAIAPAKQALCRQICAALRVHAAIEEELFYPAIRRADGDLSDLVNEAAVEHQSLKDIIGRLEAAPPDDPLYDAGVKVLSEYVKHHVQEEESEIFPMTRNSAIDLTHLGQRMLARKAELQKGKGTPAGTMPRSRNGAGNKANDGPRAG